MFRLQRRYLVQKIWSAREICIGDQVSAKAFGFLKEAVHNFLGGLDLTSLRRLAKIVGEKDPDACLSVNHLNPAEFCIQKQRYLISRVWRWPDLKDGSELKHIEDSSGEEGEAGMGDCLCVNPFHFSRISKRGKCICNVFITPALCLRTPPRQSNQKRCFKIILCICRNPVSRPSWRE
jgi:hypothetical protein